MKKLGEYIQENEYLEELYIANCQITDKGIEILSEYVRGNIKLKELALGYNDDVTDASVPLLIDIIKTSHIHAIHFAYTSIYDQKHAIEEALRIPLDRREIPIKSNTKSAAKASSSSPIL